MQKKLNAARIQPDIQIRFGFYNFRYFLVLTQTRVRVKTNPSKTRLMPIPKFGFESELIHLMGWPKLGPISLNNIELGLKSTWYIKVKWYIIDCIVVKIIYITRLQFWIVNHFNSYYNLLN